MSKTRSNTQESLFSKISWIAIECALLLAVIFLPYSKSMVEIGLTTCLILWFLRKWLFRERFTTLSFDFYTYLLLMILMIWHCFGHAEYLQETVYRGALKWFQALGVFFVGCDYFKDTLRRKRFLFFFMGVMVVLSLNGIYQMWHGFDLFKGYASDVPGRFIRMRSSLQAPNDLAAFYLFTLPLSFYYWVKEKSWSSKAVWHTSTLFLFTFCFFFTLSRSAFLGLFFASAMWLILSKRFKLILLIFAAALIPAVGSDLFRNNFILSLNFSDITVSERWQIWEVAFRIWRDAPFFGHGTNTFHTLFTQYVDPALKFRGYAHNAYLQIAAEIGLAGLLLFLLPITRRLFFARYRLSGLNGALFVGVCAYLIQAVFDTHFFSLQATALFWLFWGLYSASGSEEKDRL